MKKLLFTIVIGLGLLTTHAQVQKLSGPRIGLTFVTEGIAADFINEGFDYVDDDNYINGETGSAIISQYGWQWESRFADGGGDISGIVEWVALVGGMEKGLFLPSLSSVIGLRTSNGLEFGVGPNLSLSGIGMIFAIGHNFKSGSLNLPVNLVFVPGRNESGARISLMVGFNMGK